MKQTATKETFKNTHISYATVGKRTGALFVDLILTFFLMIMLSLATVPVLQNAFNYSDMRDAVALEMRKSYLFETTEVLADDLSNLDDVLLAQDEVTQEIMLGKSETYAFRTFKYYTVFLQLESEDNEYTTAWYIENVLKIGDEDTLFEIIVDPAQVDNLREIYEDVDYFVPEGVKLRENTTNEALKKFNEEIYGYALYTFNHRDVILQGELLVATIELINMLLLIVVASSVFFLALPLFLKNGKTLGKLLFKISVTTKHGFKIGPLGLLLRYFAFLLIEIILSSALGVILFGNLLFPIFPFISLTIIVFSAERKSLHDFVSGTIVVDDEKSVIYNNITEYNHAVHLASKAAGRMGDDVNEELFSERFRDGSGA
ncbi:MAG TPA: RDD family protein [Bacilli bacterium]|nr:RDD family protein [Bacilli bacterium]